MTTKIRKLSMAAFVGGLVVISTGLSGPGNSGTDNVVKIDNFSFAPTTLTIKAGTEVRWKNQDDIPHTVVSAGQQTFKSKVLDTDEESTYTFTKPGTYKYFCSIHPKMTATVVVQ